MIKDMKTDKKSLSNPKERTTKKSNSKPKEKTRSINIKEKIPQEDMSKILLTQLTKIKIKTVPTFHKAKLTPVKPDDKINISKVYLKRESMKQILSYGSDIYQTSKRLESNGIPPNFLKKHKINSKLRTKMIDWFMEVFYVYQSEKQTFFLSVDILDHYFHKCNYILTDHEIHLIGIVSLYIASKMEDLFPLRMHNITVQIGHNKFTQPQIKAKELEILKAISFDLIRITPYEFIQTYIYDFLLNNEEQCRKLKIKPHLKAFENTCLFLAKMMTLDDEFSSYHPSLKAICCVIAGYDILRSNSIDFTKGMESFMKEWILFLIDESTDSSEIISKVYKKLIDLYGEFERTKNKTSNLTNRHYIITTANLNEERELRLSTLESIFRLRRNILNDSLDDEDINANEEYFDFRNYPLNINWAEINSPDNRSYEILETYGYIGVYVYNKLHTHSVNFKCSTNSFIQALVDIYFISYKNTEETNQSEQSKIIKTILPGIKVIHELIINETILKKEIVFIKVLLDIYEHYYLKYDQFDSDTILNYLLPACLTFYSKLNEIDVDSINSKVKAIKVSNPFYRKI